MSVHGSETCIILIDGNKIKGKSRIGACIIYAISEFNPLCSGLGGADPNMLAKCLGAMKTLQTIHGRPNNEESRNSLALSLLFRNEGIISLRKDMLPVWYHRGKQRCISNN